MGGESVSAGAENQAEAAAFVAVRMLLQRPLNWTGGSDDVPVAITGEVGGPGDDLRVELASSQSSLEVQNKRALVGFVSLRETIAAMVRGLSIADPASEIVLAVSSGSSVEIRDRFAADVRHFRQGRRQDLRSITRDVLVEVEGAELVLSRLNVVTLDADRDFDAHRIVAIDQLRQVMVQPDHAENAWDVLVRQALKIGQKERWTRESVKRLFDARGWGLKPIGPDAALLEQIDFARMLTKAWRHRTAAGVLEHIREDVRAQAVNGDTRRQFHAVRGGCALALGDVEQAQREFKAALDFLPVRPGSDDSGDTRQRWCDARSNLAWSHYLRGEAAEANDIATDVLSVDERHVHAWAILARSKAAELTPPGEVGETTEYKQSVAHFEARNGDWRRIVEMFSSQATPLRDPDSLRVLAQALFNLSTDEGNPFERKQLLERCERAASEAIRILENGELDLLLAGTVVIRGRAREALGVEAQRDFEWASRLSPNDPNVLVRVVQRRSSVGDLVGALALLNDVAAGSDPTIRLMRADLRAQVGERTAAGEDLDQVLDELPSAATKGSLTWHLQAADLGLAIERPDLVQRALDAIDRGGLSDDGPDPHVCRARLAIAQGDLSTVDSEFRAAAARATPDDARIILSELATAFGRLGKLDESIATFEQADATTPDHPAFANYVVSLLKAERFDRVTELGASIEQSLTRQGRSLLAMPAILIEALVEVAMQREDHPTAAKLLRVRIEQDQAAEKTVRIDLMLNAAAAHALSGQHVFSAKLIDDLLLRSDLTPRDRMRAAQVLVQLGENARALDVAFMAVRAMPNDARMVASFIHVAVTPTLRRAGAAEDGEDLQPTSSSPEDVEDGSDRDDDVGPDGRSGTVGAHGSFVRAITPDNQVHEFFIYQDGPTDARLNEFLASDPAVSDLIGRSVGDVVVRNAGTWGEVRLRIDRVMPAVVVVVRRYLRTFGVQHPDVPLLKMFNVGRVPTHESLAPVIAELHRAKDTAQRALAAYRESPLPLGVLAKAIGRSLIETTSVVTADEPHRVWVDSPHFEPYSDGVRTAREATAVVLTRPALRFLDAVGLWDALATRYRLLVPKAMMDDWADELRDLEEANERGRASFYEVGGRLGVGSVPAGAMRPWLAASRALHDRVVAVSDVLHRPASALGAAADRLRQTLGAPSFDAAAIAKAEGAALYADDLGLRVIAHHETGAGSFATLHLLEVLRSEGQISDTSYDRAVIKLIELGHDLLPIRAGTIAAAFAGQGEGPHAPRLVLDRLADARVTAESAAIVAASGMASVIRSRIVTVNLADAAVMTAKALVAHREPSTVLPAYLAVLREQLRLLPLEFRTIAQATKRVLDEHRLLNGPEE